MSRLVTLENDFPRGDVEIVVAFSDWRRHDGLAFPYQVELSWDGVVLHGETREQVQVNPQLDEATFVMPQTCPFDPEEAERGLFNEQWIYRALAMGCRSLDAREVESVDITPEVVTFGGGIHHSMAIALEFTVVVVDPPQHEERCWRSSKPSPQGGRTNRSCIWF